MIADTNPMRIAIGEDNSDLADALSMFIDLQPDMQCLGHAATSTGLQALLDETRPDACVVDLQLADGSSLPLLRRIRAARPDCRLIAFSGDSNPALTAACHDAGCDAVVRKDGHPLAIVEALRALRR